MESEKVSSYWGLSEEMSAHEITGQLRVCSCMCACVGAHLQITTSRPGVHLSSPSVGPPVCPSVEMQEAAYLRPSEPCTPSLSTCQQEKTSPVHKMKNKIPPQDDVAAAIVCS